jgi:hypothetical protein
MICFRFGSIAQTSGPQSRRTSICARSDPFVIDFSTTPNLGCRATRKRLAWLGTCRFPPFGKLSLWDVRSYFGTIFWFPPGDPGGGTIGIVKSEDGGGFVIPASPTGGGRITPVSLPSG